MKKLDKFLVIFDYWFYRAIIPVVLSVTIIIDLFINVKSTYIFSMIAAVCSSKIMWYIAKEVKDDADNEGTE